MDTLRNPYGFKKFFFIAFVLLFAFALSMLSIYGLKPLYFGIVAFGFIILLSFLFWEKAVIFLMVWILFVGAVRKWLLPQLADMVFLFNNVILLGVYLRYLNDQAKSRSSLFIYHPINNFLAFFFIWGLACLFNPQLPNILVGVLGLVVHFYYIPLIFIVPRIFNTKEELIKALKIYTYFSIPLLILGIIQFSRPSDDPLNIYVGGVRDDIALVGTFVRVTSTFAYISGYAAYLNILIMILVYLLGIKGHSKVFYIYLYSLLVFALMNMFMTGSRGPALFALINVVLYLFLAGFFNLVLLKRFFLRFFFAGVLTISFFTFTDFGHKVVDAFTNRLTTNEDIGPRLLDTYTTPFKFVKIAGIYGFGIGSTYQGAAIVGSNAAKLQKITGGFEEEPERMVVEMGVAGFIQVYLIRFLLIVYFWRLYRKLKDENLKLLALLAMLFQLQFFVGISNLVFNYTTQIFYWFAVSFLYLLPRLDQKAPGYAKA